MTNFSKLEKAARDAATSLGTISRWSKKIDRQLANELTALKLVRTARLPEGKPQKN